MSFRIYLVDPCNHPSNVGHLLPAFQVYSEPTLPPWRQFSGFLGDRFWPPGYAALQYSLDKMRPTVGRSVYAGNQLHPSCFVSTRFAES